MKPATRREAARPIAIHVRRACNLYTSKEFVPVFYTLEGIVPVINTLEGIVLYTSKEPVPVLNK